VNKKDRFRSFLLNELLPLARLPGVTLVSVQHGSGVEQLYQADVPAGVVDLSREVDVTSWPFLDLAAAMKNLDLVVTCDTACGHLAGALGVPVWVALPFVPDFRWQLKGNATAWYPSMCLFRQQRSGAWGDVFEAMAAALEQEVAKKRPR